MIMFFENLLRLYGQKEDIHTDCRQNSIISIHKKSKTAWSEIFTVDLDVYHNVYNKITDKSVRKYYVESL